MQSSSGGQLDKSRALQSEGLEGLPDRARELLTLGSTFFLAFLPLGTVVAVIFATLAFGLGDSFVRQGGSAPPPYVDPDELLQVRKLTRPTTPTPWTSPARNHNEESKLERARFPTHPIVLQTDRSAPPFSSLRLPPPPSLLSVRAALSGAGCSFREVQEKLHGLRAGRRPGGVRGGGRGRVSRTGGGGSTRGGGGHLRGGRVIALGGRSGARVSDFPKNEISRCAGASASLALVLLSPGLARSVYTKFLFLHIFFL